MNNIKKAATATVSTKNARLSRENEINERVKEKTKTKTEKKHFTALCMVPLLPFG